MEALEAVHARLLYCFGSVDPFGELWHNKQSCAKECWCGCITVYSKNPNRWKINRCIVCGYLINMVSFHDFRFRTCHLLFCQVAGTTHGLSTDSSSQGRFATTKRNPRCSLRCLPLCSFPNIHENPREIKVWRCAEKLLLFSRIQEIHWGNMRNTIVTAYPGQSSASRSSSLIFRSAPVSGNHPLDVSSGKIDMFNNPVKPPLWTWPAMACPPAIWFDRKKPSSGI